MNRRTRALFASVVPGLCAVAAIRLSPPQARCCTALAPRPGASTHSSGPAARPPRRMRHARRRAAGVAHPAHLAPRPGVGAIPARDVSGRAGLGRPEPARGARGDIPGAPTAQTRAVRGRGDDRSRSRWWGVGEQALGGGPVPAVRGAAAGPPPGGGADPGGTGGAGGAEPAGPAAPGGRRRPPPTRHARGPGGGARPASRRADPARGAGGVRTVAPAPGRRAGSGSGGAGRERAAGPSNLPVPLTSFVGRERERAEVAALLAAQRLVTLTGPGGTGKTRLALQVATEVLAAYPGRGVAGGAGGAGRPGAGAPHRAAAAGVPEEPGRPLLVTLVEALRPRRLLLVLDNCEHLLDACARLAHALLRACPRLGLLCTSREALGIAGETVWRVPSLPVPPAAGPTGRAAPRPTPGAPRTWPGTRRCACSATGRRRCSRGSPSPPRTRRRWGRCAPGWTASPWPSSWPPPACGCCLRRSCWPGWRTASGC